MPLNADGFGIGWYSKHGPAIFRSVTPAWNNRNLRELCGTVESTCVMSHVRAASPGGVVSEENCHPFRFGPLLFQHNGHVEGWSRVKRRVMAELRDDIYDWVEVGPWRAGGVARVAKERKRVPACEWRGVDFSLRARGALI